MGRTELIKRIYNTLLRDNSFICTVANSPDVLSGRYTERRKALELIKLVLDETYNIVLDAIVKEEKVALLGFGTLEAVQYEDRTKYDFQQKKVVDIPGIRTVKFKVSQKIKDAARGESLYE